MKKFIIIAAAALAVGVAVPATASADGYVRYCFENDTSVKDLETGKNSRYAMKCASARKVMRAWMNRDISYACPLDGLCRVRVGWEGRLWKCFGYRDYGQLRRYSVSCSHWSGRWVSFKYIDA